MVILADCMGGSEGGVERIPMTAKPWSSALLVGLGRATHMYAARTRLFKLTYRDIQFLIINLHKQAP
jgi:hypothetical protein